MLDGAIFPGSSDAAVQANLTVVFVVKYQPGNLTALCVNGSTVLPDGPTATLATAGDPARIVLTTDRPVLEATYERSRVQQSRYCVCGPVCLYVCLCCTVVKLLLTAAVLSVLMT